MNFKDLYKSANDNIHANKEIINTIFEKSEAKPAFNYKYASLCAAAALMVLCIGVFNVTHIKPQPKDETMKVATNDNEAPNDTKEPNNKSSKAAEDKEDKEIKKQDNNIHNSSDIDNETEEKKNKSKMLLYRLSQATGTGGTENNPNAESSFEAAPDLQHPDNSMVYNDLPMTASDTGHGGAAYSPEGEDGDFTYNPQYWSVDEYNKYLGIDVSKFSRNLPNNLKLVIPKTVTVYVNDKSKVTDDVAQFVTSTAAKSKGHITVSTSKISELGNKNNKTENVKINGCNVSVTYGNGGLYNACYKKDNVWISISSQGIDKDDFIEYVASTLK